MNQKPSPGRIVLFRERDHVHERNNSLWPAIVTKVLDAEAGVVNLRVFGDPALFSSDSNNWRGSVPYDETGERPNSWSWPPRV